MGFQVAFVADQVTTVWAPTGIALAALLVLGRMAITEVLFGEMLGPAFGRGPLHYVVFPFCERRRGTLRSTSDRAPGARGTV